MVNGFLATIKQLNSELNFLIKTKGQEPKLVLSVPPKEWSKVPSTENDSWKLLSDYSDSLKVTACLYKGKQGSRFPAHKHPSQSEVLTVENREGSILVITKSYEKVLGFMDSVVFEENEEHYIEFLTDTVLLCRWKPQFKNNTVLTNV